MRRRQPCDRNRHVNGQRTWRDARWNCRGLYLHTVDSPQGRKVLSVVTPVGRATWLTLALIVFMGLHTGIALTLNGEVLAALFVGLLYPAMGSLHWWTARKLAGPVAAEAYDQGLQWIMFSQLMIAMVTVWR